jgi:putative transposase
LKGAAGRLVFQRYPEVKKQVWGGAFWSFSYSVGSVGDMSVDAGDFLTFP